MDSRCTLGTLVGQPGDAPLDLEKLIGSHACVVANSGGGKSGLIRRLLETTYGHVQHIILDAEDEFYTLREKFAYIIAGGDDGDVPISLENAPALALAILENGLSAVIQLNDLKQREEFISLFLTALVDAPKRLWHPLLVVIDEAQRFVPEAGNTAATPGIRELMMRGRKRGFTGILCSPRLAEISKTMLSPVNNWFLGRVGHATDRKAVAYQLGFSATSPEAIGLQSLPPRTFYMFGPAATQVPTLFRVGDVQTTIVRSGQAKLPTPPAPEKLRKILAALAKTATAADVAAEKKAAPADPAAPGTLDAAERLEKLGDVIKTLERNCADLETDRTRFRAAVYTVAYQLVDLVTADGMSKLAVENNGVAISGADPDLPENWGQLHPPRTLKYIPPASDPGPRIEANGDAADGKLPKAIRAVLAVLRAHYPRARSRESVALQARYSKKSGGFRNTLSEARTAGYIEGSATLSITPAGLKAIGKVEPVPTGRALVDYWMARLDKAERKILDVLTLSGKRQGFGREYIALRSGYQQSGGFRNALSTLRTLGLISGSREIKAAEEFFS